MCVVMAICMVLLYIWPVLFVVGLAVPMEGLRSARSWERSPSGSSSSFISRGRVRRAETAIAALL